jgi:type IV pilus assembly protein PilA
MERNKKITGGNKNMQKLLTKKRNKGFTLIELIVVIAVIAVLVLLATPKFLDYTRDAKIAQIKNDIKVAEEVVEEYLIKNNDTLPDSLTPIDLSTPLGEEKLWETKA